MTERERGRGVKDSRIRGFKWFSWYLFQNTDGGSVGNSRACVSEWHHKVTQKQTTSSES